MNDLLDSLENKQVNKPEKKTYKFSYLKHIMSCLLTLLAANIAQNLLSSGVIVLNGWLLALANWVIATVIMFTSYLMLALLTIYSLSVIVLITVFAGIILLGIYKSIKGAVTNAKA